VTGRDQRGPAGRPACGQSRAIHLACQARADRGSAAATSSTSRASTAAQAPRPVPPTRRASCPAPPAAPTASAAHRRPARAPARRSPPPPSAPHRLIRQPESGPCRLNAYAFSFRATCSSSNVQWVWSRLWSLSRSRKRASIRRCALVIDVARRGAGAKPRSSDGVDLKARVGACCRWEERRGWCLSVVRRPTEGVDHPCPWSAARPWISARTARAACSAARAISTRSAGPG
jgi:hypothetical protein